MLSGMEPRVLPSSSAPGPPLRPVRVCPFCREGAPLWCARAVLKTNEHTPNSALAPGAVPVCVPLTAKVIHSEPRHQYEDG